MRKVILENGNFEQLFKQNVWELQNRAKLITLFSGETYQEGIDSFVPDIANSIIGLKLAATRVVIMLSDIKSIEFYEED